MGFRTTVREMYSRYCLPLLVTENDLGAHATLTEDGKIHDSYRITYLQDHIEQIQLAITDGVDMMGYPHGRLLTIFQPTKELKNVMDLLMLIVTNLF